MAEDGRGDRGEEAGFGAPPKGVVAAAALWVLFVAAYAAGFFGLFGEGAFGPRASNAVAAAFFLIAALAPAALIAQGALLFRTLRDLRRAAASLAAGAGGAIPPPPAASDDEAMERLAERLRADAAEAADKARAETAATLARLEASLAETRAALDAARAPADAAVDPAAPEKRTAGVLALSDGAQAALPLGEEAVEGRGGVPWSSVARALDFPRDPADKEGFRALRDVVADREFAELLQAAEDVLTLLAADGLYMEDLTPEPAPPELWRAYAGGARGVEVAALAGVTDDAALASVRSRMRANAVFRDASLHFLRRFDRLMARMDEELGDDPMIAAIGDTRTGRAFMLIAKTAGVFERGRGRAPKT